MSLFGARGRLPLVVHAGLRDTGCALLQRALVAHDAPLREAGIVYPTAGRRGAAHHELPAMLGFGGAPAAPAGAAAGQIVEAWHEEISRVRGATGLVSSELLGLPGDHAALTALLEPRFDVRVVVYLQRHDVWTLSLYAGALRSQPAPRWGRGYDQFVAFRRAGEGARADAFRPVVDAWARCVGERQVVVRPVEAAEVGDDLLGDLLRSAGLAHPPAGLPSVPAAAIAPRLSFEGAHFIDIVAHTRLPEALKRHLAACVFADDPGERPLALVASPGLRAGQIAANFDDYEYIAQRFLGRRDGLLFRDPTPSDERSTWKAPTVFSSMWFAEHLCRYLGQGSESVWQALREVAAGAAPPSEEPSP